MDIKLSRVSEYLDWLKSMTLLDIMAPRTASRQVMRGEVYRCNLGRGIGSEQEKDRPCVILQNYRGNVTSPNTKVAPITHTVKGMSVVVPITTQYNPDQTILLDGHVLLGNIVTVSKSRLGKYVATLSSQDMEKIDEAVCKSLGIWYMLVKKDNILKHKEGYVQILKNRIDELNLELDRLRTQVG